MAAESAEIGIRDPFEKGAKIHRLIGRVLRSRFESQTEATGEPPMTADRPSDALPLHQRGGTRISRVRIFPRLAEAPEPQKPLATAGGSTLNPGGVAVAIDPISPIFDTS
jgi:hypothetical protein